MAFHDSKIHRPSGDDAEDTKRFQRIQALAQVMDELIPIPGTRYRVGLDGLIGLIPGVGDIFGFIVSTYFILLAAQMKVSKVVIIRMFVNLAIDVAVGLIPFVGDLTDFVWKANRKNLKLLEVSLADPRRAKRSSAGFLILLILACLTFAGLLGWGLILLVRNLIEMIATL
ncbi:MAG: DUF4112 domain-containing protein [Bdellovibrionales bacterium]